MLYAHHLIIAGNLQHRGRLAGCDRVAARLDAFRQPGVRVELLRWNHDWQAELAFIARHAGSDKYHPPPRVCLHAYSWGGGWGARQFCRASAALEQPIPVYGLSGCDMVYRHNYPLGNWRALVPLWKIRFPWTLAGAATRNQVRLFYQDNTLPRGQRVIVDTFGEVPREKIENVVVNGNLRLVQRATHYNLDECQQWHDASVELAEQCAWQVDVDRTF